MTNNKRGDQNVNTKTMSISNAEKRLQKLLRLTIDIEQRIAINNNGLLRFHLNHAIGELTQSLNTAQLLRGKRHDK